MFGHSDKDKNQDENTAPPVQDEPVTVHPGDNTGDGGNDSPAPDNPAGDDQAAGNSDWQHPGMPLDETQAEVQPEDGSDDAPAPADDTAPASSTPISDVTPAGGNSGSIPPPPPLSDVPTPPAGDLIDGGDDRELVDIRQQALTQLTPLVGHLDQKPEEKFRTLMMVIQASDDQHLVKDAYEAAKAIEDEKVRAQALLDIVNEINYFTSQHQG